MSNAAWLVVALLAVALSLALYAGSLYSRKRRIERRLQQLKGSKR